MVSTAQGQAIADRLQCPFLETSAKTGSNVEAVWRTLIREIWSYEGESSNDSVSEGGEVVAGDELAGGNDGGGGGGDGGDGGCCVLL